MDGVVRPVHVEIEARHDEVLVERRVGALVDQCPVRGLAAFGEGRGDHDPGGADLALDAAVLVEAPVDEVLVVGHGDVEGDHEAPRAPHLRAGPLVHVLPTDAVVLLVDADRVRDRSRLPAGVVHDSVQVGDLAEAVAAELQRGGHEAQAPLADVERGPPVVIGGGVPVRDDHLGEREPVRDRPEAAAVAEPYGVQDQSLAVVEAQAQLPVLPGQLPAAQREGHSVGLADVQRLHLAQRHRDERRPVLAHDVGRLARRLPLLSGVEAVL